MEQKIHCAYNFLYNTNLDECKFRTPSSVCHHLLTMKLLPNDSYAIVPNRKNINLYHDLISITMLHQLQLECCYWRIEIHPPIHPSCYRTTFLFSECIINKLGRFVFCEENNRWCNKWRKCGHIAENKLCQYVYQPVQYRYGTLYCTGVRFKTFCNKNLLILRNYLLSTIPYEIALQKMNYR